MNLVEFSIITTSAATIAVACIYFYLYIQYREHYIGFWLLSWLLQLSRLAFQKPTPHLDIIQSLLYLLILITSSLLLIYATNLFFAQKWSRNWLYLAFATLFLNSLFIFLEVPFNIKSFPICMFMSFAHIWTGNLYIRHLAPLGWGKYITGWTFILLGIHIIDYPFLSEISWFAPWGFLIDATLRFMVAVGTLIVYFEKSRKDLLEKEHSYRLLAENALDVIYRYRLGANEGFEYISPSVYKLIGYTPEYFYNTSKEAITQLIHPNDHPVLNISTHSRHSPLDFLTFRVIDIKGNIIWVEQRSTPILNKEGECVGFEGIIRDITVRRSLEQDVSRLDRLNTVGQMAANVAHEIRNPLTTIHGYLQVFINKKEFSHYKDQISLLIDELNRTDLIIKEYLSLSRNKIVDLKPLCINETINTLYPLLKASANASSKYIFLDLAPTPHLYLDEKEIRQLLLNLVRNGLEAMDAGKTLFIRTHCNQIINEVVLTVQDQGPGIPNHVIDKIGQPFVTTKENGTGLGLAVCYRIASRHQASINVETSPEGTSFHVHFKYGD